MPLEVSHPYALPEPPVSHLLALLAGDLYQRIRKQGSKPLPEAQIRRWTGEILSALKAVHDRKAPTKIETFSYQLLAH